MPGNSQSVSTKQQRIAELAKRSPPMGFTSLAYLMDIDWLREAFQRTRKDGAPGVDGQTWAEYAENLEANLQSLLDRAKSGTYRAPPVRRVHIPKPGAPSETRPIGIPTLEDKVLQRAVVMLLEPIYEHDFYDGSYGFRRGRSAHQALAALWKQTMASGGGWILEVDIRKFFDTLDHAHLREFLQRRVRDGVLKRLIGKWLKAGVLEDGSVSYPDAGSPQGGVITPPTILQKTGLLWTTSSPGCGCGRVMGRVGRHRNFFRGWRLRQGCPVRRSQPWRVPLRLRCGG
jgi:RNA-directed DNA polymerase